jgi:cysteine synthase B
MGTTGTIMGVSETLKKHNQAIQIIGVQPEDGAKIAGIRRWPIASLRSWERFSGIINIIL